MVCAATGADGTVVIKPAQLGDLPEAELARENCTAGISGIFA